jgi:hypothetical protein
LKIAFSAAVAVRVVRGSLARDTLAVADDDVDALLRDSSPARAARTRALVEMAAVVLQQRSPLDSPALRRQAAATAEDLFRAMRCRELPLLVVEVVVAERVLHEEKLLPHQLRQESCRNLARRPRGEAAQGRRAISAESNRRSCRKGALAGAEKAANSFWLDFGGEIIPSL